MAEMPRAEFPSGAMLRAKCLKVNCAGNPLTEAEFYVCYGAQAQRELLENWVELPSVEELSHFAIEYTKSVRRACIPYMFPLLLHSWLRERGKDG